METVCVTIRGTAPLLMHRYPLEKDGADLAARKDQTYDPKEDAERALYRNAEGCYVPSTWVEACLRDTAKEFKGKGRSSLKATVLASVFVEPEEIPLGKTTYDEIDRRPCVIQRMRIVRSRPRFNSWEIAFKITYDETRIKKDVLRQMLEEAGRSKGIGDYRPKFGRFEIIAFE
ncbi:MAG: hypothetical protein AB1696_11345 [Planctomycetota bacterium]